MPTERINFLDLHFDRLSFQDVKDRLRAAGPDTRYAYVVTPNVDHMVRLLREPELRPLYEKADLCVCDSRILRFLARLRGIELPLVAGSDLCVALFAEVVEPGDRIAVVGADRSCIDQMRRRFPQVQFAHFEPPMGLRTDPEARRSAADFVASTKARFTLLAVGSPQQEMIAHEAGRVAGASGIALCIGAGLDFIIGKQKRAPEWVQKLGLEWSHRLLTNPRRLWRRYLVEDIRIFPIWLRWRRKRGRSPSTVLMAVLALAGISAAAYLGLALTHGRRSQPSWSGPVPSAEQSVAAIKALPPPNLLKPVSPEEAAKENAERPFADRPDSAASRFVLGTDAEDHERALTCLAQAAYYEAAGEGLDGQRAVAQVVINRLRHPGFPSTVCGVVYEGSDRPTGCKFSFTCDGSMQRIPVPSLWKRSREIAEEALKGRVFAPVGHATHYHADYVLPYWADTLDKSAQVGRHIFYRLRSTLGDARAFSQHYGGTEPPFRVPGATLVIPQTAETEQLTNTLLSGGTPAAAQPGSQKASPPPPQPLAVDSNPGTLLADVDGPAPTARKAPRKKGSDCEASTSGPQLSPLRADNMRPSENSGC